MKEKKKKMKENTLKKIIFFNNFFLNIFEEPNIKSNNTPRY